MNGRAAKRNPTKKALRHPVNTRWQPREQHLSDRWQKLTHEREALKQILPRSDCRENLCNKIYVTQPPRTSTFQPSAPPPHHPTTPNPGENPPVSPHDPLPCFSNARKSILSRHLQTHTCCNKMSFNACDQPLLRNHGDYLLVSPQLASVCSCCSIIRV